MYTFIGDHFAMLKSPQNEDFECRLLHCGVQAREHNIERSGEGWLGQHVQRWQVYHLWQLLCKVVTMQELICIIVRCTHYHNL